MKALFQDIRQAVVSTMIFAVILCGAYPLLVWGLGQLAFKEKANGSLITDAAGTVRGSALLAQGFSGAQYFHPRPSAAGANGYDATSSSGSNLGPTSQKLFDQIKGRIAAYRSANGLTEADDVPADAVTASGSGLDPHISVQNAAMQAARVAKARHKMSVEQVRELIKTHTEGPDFGIFGEPGVNVLRLNLSLDALP